MTLERAQDTQVKELLGRNRLVNELLEAGLEVAIPLRDRGVDLIAYADLSHQVDKFVARPIQMKAASKETFSLDKKYAKITDLIIAYVWHLDGSGPPVTFAYTYKEALGVITEMGWVKTKSWTEKGKYANTQPGERLTKLMVPYMMTADKWCEKLMVRFRW